MNRRNEYASQHVKIKKITRTTIWMEVMVFIHDQIKNVENVNGFFRTIGRNQVATVFRKY